MTLFVAKSKQLYILMKIKMVKLLRAYVWMTWHE